MAAQIKGSEWTVTDTITSLTDVLGLSERVFISTILVKAGPTNTGIVYWGGADLAIDANRWGYVDQQEGAAIDMDQAFFSSDGLYFIGTAGDTLHVTWAA